MNKKCFDIGTIQAFLDGELAPAVSAEFTNHIGDCDACAIALAEAEEETAFAFSALENEFNTLVPTQRLWTKINDSIVEEKKQSSVWHRLWSFMSISLLNPSITVAAGIFVIFGIFAVALTLRPAAEDPTIAVKQTPPNRTVNQTNVLPAEGNKIIASAAPELPAEREVLPIERVQNRQVSRPNDFQKMVVKADYRSGNSAKRNPGIATPKAENLLYLPGEESYVKTIATLKQTVDGQKDTVMKPSSRIAFERDLAVVNDSIEKMKEEVRRNPKNETAKQVLYASYQNKIDLLNSIAERNELMASMQ